MYVCVYVYKGARLYSTIYITHYPSVYNKIVYTIGSYSISWNLGRQRRVCFPANVHVQRQSKSRRQCVYFIYLSIYSACTYSNRNTSQQNVGFLENNKRKKSENFAKTKCAQDMREQGVRIWRWRINNVCVCVLRADCEQQKLYMAVSSAVKCVGYKFVIKFSNEFGKKLFGMKTVIQTHTYTWICCTPLRIYFVGLNRKIYCIS